MSDVASTVVRNQAVEKWTNIPRAMRKEYLRNMRISRNEREHEKRNQGKNAVETTK